MLNTYIIHYVHVYCIAPNFHHQKNSSISSGLAHDEIFLPNIFEINGHVLTIAHVCVDSAVTSLYQYLKSTTGTNKSILPSPVGPLSSTVPSLRIAAANKNVREIMSVDHGGESSSQGTYMKYTANEKVKVAHYAVQHGTSAAIQHFKAGLK